MEKKRKYWLGHGKPSEQDRFFIDALDDDLWEIGDNENWDTCWYTGMPDDDVFESLEPEQTINHIPGNSALTIKSNLYDTLMNTKHRLIGTEYETRFNFFPETFLMPEDYFHYQKVAQQEPDQLWIKKPRNLSRGRGIDMVRHPATIPFDDEWIIQRYLSNPHLCQGRKYVLRCYVLVTSVEPLRFYWYQDGFAKLASEPYSSDDLHNLYRHLTNPDINEENENADSAVTFISFQRYREWLREEGHDDESFFDALKDMITLTVIAARESMRKRINSTCQNSQGCYELIGLDCMVDDNIKPWIIECNLSPSLSTYADPDAGADDEVNAKRSMVSDLVNLVGLNNIDNPHLSWQEKQRQEQQQAGNFECLFPNDNANEYLPTFPIPRYKDIKAAEHSTSVNTHLLSLEPQTNYEHTFSDSVAIFGSKRARKNHANHIQPIAPNEMASWIWLKNASGDTPDTIIQELAASLPPSEDPSIATLTDSIAEQVWDVLADWGQANVFTQENISQQRHSSIQKEPTTGYLIFGDKTIALHFFCDVAAQYWKPLYHTNIENTKIDTHIDIIESTYGYSMIVNRTTVTGQLKLSELFTHIHSALIQASNEHYLLAGHILNLHNQNTLIISTENDIRDAVSHKLVESGKATSLSHYALINHQQKIIPLYLPIKLPYYENDKSVAAEYNDELFYYLKGSLNTNQKEQPSIETMNPIEKILWIKHAEENTVVSLSKSQGLKNLWESYPLTDINMMQVIAEWLESIDSLEEIHSKNIDDSVKAIIS